MTPSLLTEWSRLLMGTLARAGVEHVVLSPGSRSTPFAWAALNEPGLRTHSVWDERVAGFFALGQARLSGRPSLRLCTTRSIGASGSPVSSIHIRRNDSTSASRVATDCCAQ